jgi:phosphatidate cytidylyltransferase
MTGVRVITALILAPAVLAVVWWAPLWLFAGTVALVAALALFEFFALGAQAGMRGYWPWTLLCALLLALAQAAQSRIQSVALPGSLSFVRSPEYAWISVEHVLLLFAVGMGLAATVNRRPVGETLGAVGLSSAGLLLVALPVSCMIRVQAEEHGRIWTMFLLWLVWAGDSAAYFVGRAFGRLKMAPEISPKKTWEGAAGNLAGSLLVAAVFARWLDVPGWQLLLAAVLANGAGQAGDLLESAYKRSAGVKDSGAILPGHGGVLDRIDALIFAAPVVWMAQQFISAR